MTKAAVNRLGEWMKANRYSDPLFAAEVSKRQPRRPVSAKTVFNWRHGVRVPRAHSMSTIMEITNYEVTANDFVKVSKPLTEEPNGG